MSTKQVILAVVAVVLLGVSGYLIYNSTRPEQAPAGPAPQAKPEDVQPAAPSLPSDKSSSGSRRMAPGSS